ncbi:MAG: NUDIX domain-containing protein [Acidobacteria bacterium]|nr:NUDIX domain-containing protein [Acidobacteriota bacterium]NIM62217.1 NUDIX domain-containing protein [Acidobacteriota bacterium]NIO58999.1 NUDIX domain-containing protein [Acidobacteriota bacterium]NIQ30045.1 NUDIX domain-containing protein [Acidobacteriota bacterium]NIQ84811.1 NUDIX domain-containing protein [Acidobacteriota bacterium]
MNTKNPVSSRQVYAGRFLTVNVDEVLLPDGRSCELEMIRHPGAAAVVPVDAAGNAILVRQYRYAAEGWLLEVPAGKLDPGESPESCAAREVEEETGYRVGRLEPLGWIFTTPGFTDEKIWLFRGTGLERGKQALQRNELLEVVSLPFEEAVRAAADGRIRDSKSICALLRAAGAGV